MAKLITLIDIYTMICQAIEIKKFVFTSNGQLL